MSRLFIKLFIVASTFLCIHLATQTIVTRVVSNELRLSDAGVKVVMEWCKQGLRYYKATETHQCVPKKEINFDWEIAAEIVSQAK